jgi:threonine dehydrogenase-like Zn-dependent dehydrogenase
MYGAGDVRVETVPDARLIEPTDALVTVTHACICGSDLWPYRKMKPSETGRRMGHEFIGVVEAVGAEVRTIKPGDLVVAPFVWSDGTCVFCQERLQTSCLHGGGWGSPDVDGGQGEAVRAPQADGTLVVLPVGRDDSLIASLLTLSDVMGTGHHAALAAKVGPGKTVAVVGDGAVGRVGVPQDAWIPAAVPTFFSNITIAGGPAPVRAYIEELLPDVLDGRIEPGRVFDRVTNLDGVPDGYRAMNEREAIKVMIEL